MTEHDKLIHELKEKYHALRELTAELLIKNELLREQVQMLKQAKLEQSVASRYKICKNLEKIEGK